MHDSKNDRKKFYDAFRLIIEHVNNSLITYSFTWHQLTFGKRANSAT